MIKSRIAFAGALLAAAGAANAAGFTVTPTIATDYDFRGISQTNPDQKKTDPAFQLGASFAFEDGMYAGIWGSNVDFGINKPDLELDYNLGFGWGDAKEGVAYDTGLVYYTYGSAGSLNTFEGYFGITRDIFNAKLWYSPDYSSTKNSGFYVEGNAAVPLAMDFTALAHVGVAKVQHSKSATDYSVGVARNLGNFVVTVKYIDGTTNNNFKYDNRFVATLATTLPWGK
jgi:uncharacterized protein (TIGR02001 family)